MDSSDLPLCDTLNCVYVDVLLYSVSHCETCDMDSSDLPLCDTLNCVYVDVLLYSVSHCEN